MSPDRHWKNTGSHRGKSFLSSDYVRKQDGNSRAEVGVGTKEDGPLNRSLRDHTHDEAQDQRRRDKVLQRVGEALSAAARAVMS